MPLKSFNRKHLRGNAIALVSLSRKVVKSRMPVVLSALLQPSKLKRSNAHITYSLVAEIDYGDSTSLD